MEFLVQLEDKINTQTWCFNPVHKGEKIVFDDATFIAPCKLCKETKYLYRKNNAINKKGHFITFKPDGWSWGTLERKHYGIVKIACTEKQAMEWCKSHTIPLADVAVATDQERKEASILERPRVYKFDYETIVPANMDWVNQDKDSGTYTLADLTQIKADTLIEKVI